MRLRRLAADSLKRLVQLLHFAWRKGLSPENWCFCVENGVFFGFGDHFGVFLAIWGCKTGTFSHFLWLRHSSAGRWDFGATPHLLNVTPHFRRWSASGTSVKWRQLLCDCYLSQIVNIQQSCLHLAPRGWHSVSYLHTQPMPVR